MIITTILFAVLASLIDTVLDDNRRAESASHLFASRV